MRYQDLFSESSIGVDMATDTITHETVSQLVEAGAIHAAHVVGQKGGWGVRSNMG